MSEGQEVKKLQWIKGDKLGKVETVLKEDPEWIDFESGSRINATLLNEFMVDVTNEGNLLDDINLEPSNNKKRPQQNEINNTDNKNADRLKNPIMSLLDTMDKTDTHSLDISVPISIPTKDLYKVLSNSFGDDKVKFALMNYINDQLDSKQIKNLLNKSVEHLIDSFTSQLK